MNAIQSLGIENGVAFVRSTAHPRDLDNSGKKVPTYCRDKRPRSHEAADEAEVEAE
ncbi:hypothetical protein E4U16_000744, partial [Claviceps sp. LM84 group G4]